jgi:hypothetical protein
LHFNGNPDASDGRDARGWGVIKPEKPFKKRISEVPAAYGNAADVGAYLGARSHPAVHRRLAWLRSNGLCHFLIDGIKHYRFADVDALLRKLQGDGQHG